ncbi:MAG: hypothetical protein ACI4U3_01865 [Traorella sp.]
MKSIYLLLTKSDTYVSKAIRIATSDPYTHISISFDKTLQPLYSFSRKYVNLPLPAGIRNEPLETGFYKKYNYIPCALYELQVDEKTYSLAKNEITKMLDQSEELKFNVLGLLLCKLNIPYDRKNYYFCSEFVSVILKDSNALEIPKKPCLMRPSDYTQIEKLKCLFKGKLCQLIQQLHPMIQMENQL